MPRLPFLSALACAVTFTIVGASPAAAPSSSAGRSAMVLLGNRQIASGRGSEAPGRSRAFRFTALRSGVARRVHVYVRTKNRATSIAVAIYASSRGRPSVRLTWGLLRHVVTGRWNLIGMRGAHIQKARKYWLALLGNHGTLGYRAARGGRCQSAETARSSLRRPPSRWGTWRRRDTCFASAYVSGQPLTTSATPTGGGGPGSTSGTGTGAGAPPSTGGSGSPSGNPPPPTIPPGGCFAAPGACGYPDPGYHNVGATSSCSSLQSSGPVTASTTGQSVKGLNVNGTITVNAANVTISNVCVTKDGGGQLGSRAILLNAAADNTQISHVTIAGANTSSNSVDQSIANNSGTVATVTGSYLYNCGECLWNGPWAVSDSYVITDGMQGTTDHLEDLYCSDSTATLTHDVLLDPQYQNSAIFCDTQWGGGGPCDNHISIANSLLAGGGFVIYTCGNASSVGSSTMNISNNRFARCTTAPIKYNSSTGGSACKGSAADTLGSGADGHGYWPYGGYFGIDAWTYCPPAGGQVWSGNVWDDDGSAAKCA